MFIYICTEMRMRDEKKEERVRQKALELIVKEGFDGFSMNKLAKAAGVSPGTLYIYYKDKEDLILCLGQEIGKKMTEATFKGFDKEMDLETGLWIQWKNRAEFYLNQPLEMEFYDQLKVSPFKDKMDNSVTIKFSEEMGGFIRNAINKGEALSLTPVVFWSVAFAPLYNLIRFHLDGKSMGGRPYTFSEEHMKDAFKAVLRALKV